MDRSSLDGAAEASLDTAVNYYILGIIFDWNTECPTAFSAAHMNMIADEDTVSAVSDSIFKFMNQSGCIEYAQSPENGASVYGFKLVSNIIV